MYILTFLYISKLFYLIQALLIIFIQMEKYVFHKSKYTEVIIQNDCTKKSHVILKLNSEAALGGYAYLSIFLQFIDIMQLFLKLSSIITKLNFRRWMQVENIWNRLRCYHRLLGGYFVWQLPKAPFIERKWFSKEKETISTQFFHLKF